jgi:hypothetical protein
MKELNQSKSNLLVYLAGAMENAPDSGSAWRQELSDFINNELRHRVFNPCLEESHVLTREEFHSFRKWKTTNLKRFREVVHKIIKTDLTKIIEEVDYIICLWDEHVLQGGGTHGELTMAHWFKKPVYLVTDMPLQNISRWIIGCSTEIFSDFDKLKQFLKVKYVKQ